MHGLANPWQTSSLELKAHAHEGMCTGVAYLNPNPQYLPCARQWQCRYHQKKSVRRWCWYGQLVYVLVFNPHVVDLLILTNLLGSSPRTRSSLLVRFSQRSSSLGVDHAVQRRTLLCKWVNYCHVGSSFWVWYLPRFTAAWRLSTKRYVTYTTYVQMLIKYSLYTRVFSVLLVQKCEIIFVDEGTVHIKQIYTFWQYHHGFL